MKLKTYADEMTLYHEDGYKIEIEGDAKPESAIKISVALGFVRLPLREIDWLISALLNAREASGSGNKSVMFPILNREDNDPKTC